MVEEDSYPGFYDDTPFEEVMVPKLSSSSLRSLANHYVSDKGDRYGCAHNYADIYEQYFSPIRDKPVSILEIGVARGSSLKMWASYFGNAYIEGVDINPASQGLCKDFDNINIVIKNVLDYDLTRDYDIVIDDGSHLATDVIGAFNKIFPSLRKGGIYIIEDLLACSSEAYVKEFYRYSYRRGDDDWNDFWERNSRQNIDEFYKSLEAKNIKHEIHTNGESEICFIHR